MLQKQPIPELARVLEISAKLPNIQVVTPTYENWRSLKHYQNLAPNGALSERFVSACALNILTALKKTHKDGIVHGNLDLEHVQVFLTPFGGDQFMVTDFDNARISGSKVHPIFQSEKARTEPYVSPEIADTPIDARSKPQVTTAADIWSLGILTFIMRTNCLPMNREKSNNSFDPEGIINGV